MNLIRHDVQTLTGREVFTLAVDSLESLPDAFTSPSPQFAMLLAYDASVIDHKAFDLFTRRLLDKGIALLCTWGPECERVHDWFDQEIVYMEVLEGIERPCIMTTWHDDEPLEEAIWFLLYAANPVEEYLPTCQASIIVSVGNADWDRQIREYLNSDRLTDA